MSLSANNHAGVEPRNRFLPPRAVIARLRRDTPAVWATIPPVPAFTDVSGEMLIHRVSVRLAYDERCLHLMAQVTEPAATVKEQLPPDSPQFWTQDHIELRFLRNPDHDLDQVQFIVSADGRVWDNQGLWQNGSVLAVCGGRTKEGWKVRLSVPFAALGVAVPVAGTAWRGIVAHTRWGDGHADIACSSATELGFPQAERFGEWVFAAEPAAVALARVESGRLTLVNTSRKPVEGVLRIRCERGAEAADTRVWPCRLKPGENRLPVVLPGETALFTRHVLAWAGGDRECELGAITLRAPLPVLSSAVRRLVHPYLLFDPTGLEALRVKARHAPFMALTSEVRLSREDLTGCDLPAEGDASLPTVTRNGLNWFRVAKETMVRDGAGGLKPAARRIWDLQSDRARDAWRAIVEAVTPTDGQVTLLLDELNGLLARRDFYDATAFAAVMLPEEGRSLLARGVGKLRDDEVFRLNRMVMQEAIECMHTYRMDLAFRPGELWSKWLVTGNVRLIATATRAVRAALRLTMFGHEVHLHEGMAAGALALAYDSFYPHLSRADRDAWRELLRRLLHLYLETARQHRWTVTTIANANPVGNGGCGLAALALWREDPDLAARCLAYARNYIRLWLDYCQAADGGNTEGVQYWQYGVDNFVRFAVALERVTGSDDGLLSHPAIRHGMNMIRASLCNDGALHGMNDTVPMPVAATFAWFLGGRENDAMGLWYGDHALRWMLSRQAAGKPVAYRPMPAEMLLHRPDVPEATVPPRLPCAFALRSIEYGILRSGPRYDCRWSVCLKGSRPPYTHHNQADTGALSVDLRGERLVIDPGYYKPAPTDHALPLIDGRGPCQPVGWTGAIVACEEHGDLRHLAVDASGAYGDAAERVVRHVVLAGEEGLVLLDDIAAQGCVTAQYQCGGATRLANDGRSVEVAGEVARLRMDLVTRPDADIELLPERSLHDTHWGYHFADCRLFPVTATYAGDVGLPLVTVLLDVTEVAGGASHVETAADRLAVVLPSGRRVRFVRLCGRWEWEAC